MSNLGTPRIQEMSNLWNFLNSQLYQKLNVREYWCINYLMFRSQFSVLGVPRLSRDLCLSISAIFVRFTCFLVYCVFKLACHKRYGLGSGVLHRSICTIWPFMAVFIIKFACLAHTLWLRKKPLYTNYYLYYRYQFPGCQYLVIP